MRKFTLAIAALCFAAGSLSVFAASYDDNSFQRKSREYSALAATAYDEGDYDLALQYAQEAEKNARLSEEYIRKMLLRSDAETEMNRARTRLTWAREIKANVYYASVFRSAAENVDRGARAFTNEDYEGAKRYALLALEALEGVREQVPLPAQYKVISWNPDKDCLWNIAAHEAVYGDPFQWKKLYDANKSVLPDPSNPNLVLPGTVLTIPSLHDEYREGVFDPNVDYGKFEDR